MASSFGFLAIGKYSTAGFRHFEQLNGINFLNSLEVGFANPVHAIQDNSDG